LAQLWLLLLDLLNDLAPDRAIASVNKPLSHYVTKIARLGDHIARANDPAPGNIVMWRGLARLTAPSKIARNGE